MKRNIGLIGWILCSKPCVLSLLEHLAQKGAVDEATVREGMAQVKPDPFGNYTVVLRTDSRAPSIPPEEYLSGEPTYCSACGSLCARPLGLNEAGAPLLSSGSVN